ncbi:MAG: hypothetical protein JHD02_08910 [Thermoleophilaceae bacterium]|nr:hypothetical protein [Thermoleophilaceae bacterium]
MNSRSKKRIALLGATVAVVVLAMSGIAPGAMARSCAKPGYKLVERTHQTAIVSRTVRDSKWEGGTAQKLYACSYTYGTRHYLTTAGVDENAETSLGLTVGNERYFGYALTRIDNAGKSSAHHLGLYDLKTGYMLLGVTPSRKGHSADVTALALANNGRFGWIERFEDGRQEVWLRASSANVINLATAANIDPWFLRFDSQRHLIWSTSTGNSSAGK